jgi:hypothetical protein
MSTSSHDNKKFRTRSVEKQGGMAFGLRKTATAVIKPDRERERNFSTSLVIRANSNGTATEFSYSCLQFSSSLSFMDVTFHCHVNNGDALTVTFEGAATNRAVSRQTVTGHTSYKKDF